MNELIEFLAGVMDVDPATVNENTEYGTFEKWDSMMHMRLVMEVEEQYDTEIPIEEIPDIKKLGDFLKYIQQ